MEFERVKIIVSNIVVTFVQAGFVVWSTSGFKADKLTLGAVVGAGTSAVWNIVLKPVLKKYGYLK